MHLQHQKSLRTKSEEAQDRPFFPLLLPISCLVKVAGPHGLLLPAPALLGLLEVVENGTLSDTEHVPNAAEIGLVLVLHALQPPVNHCHPLLYCLHLQLHKRRNTLVQRCVIDLVLDAVALLTHQSMDFCKRHILFDLLH